MTPLPLVPIVLAIVSVAAFATCSLREFPTRRAIIVGAVIGLACGIVLPPIGLGIYMVAVRNERDVLWVLMTMANVGGIVSLITAPLAVPCGMLSGYLGHRLRALVRRADKPPSH